MAREPPCMSDFAIVERSIAWKIASRTCCLVIGLSAPVRPAASMPRYSMRMDSPRTACRFGIRPTSSNWSGLNFQIQSALSAQQFRHFGWLHPAPRELRSG